MSVPRQSLAYFAGCLVGGAVGDALGLPVSSLDRSEINSRFGLNGIATYGEAFGRKGAISAVTQMALFTAEGQILSKVRRVEGKRDPLPIFIYHAYLRWLTTQNKDTADGLLKEFGSCNIIDGILIGHQGLHCRRAPDGKSLQALSSSRMGTIHEPVNQSKGCGGLTRVAPVGLDYGEQVFDCACEVAALTNGHPTGFLAAGSLAQIIYQVIQGDDLIDAVHTTGDILSRKQSSGECVIAFQKAITLWRENPISTEMLERLGHGDTAEEALSIGIYCALAGQADFMKGVCLAVNHSGNSRVTGAVTGNILGALLGVDAIPNRFVQALEMVDLITEIAADLFESR